MKYLFTILLFTSCTKELIRPLSSTVIDDTQISLIADTVVNDVWDGEGKVLRIEDKIIHGSGTLKNWIIDAPLNQQIFDSSIVLQNCKTYNDVFSCSWYGANPDNADNWWNIQKSVNTCLNNKISNCFLPQGKYSYSKPLEIKSFYKDDYSQSKLHFYGDASFWDNGIGTTLNYTSLIGCAFNLQLNKGSEVDHIAFKGQFKSPGGNDSVYFNLTQEQFKGNYADNYFGLAVDWRKPIKSTGGSTGLNIHDITVSGFTRLIAISPNAISYNADILLFKNIHLGDGVVGITTSQAQEKGNVFDGIYAWGNLHTVVSIGHYGKYQAGDYTFSNANIAGRVIRCFDISIGHWFSTKISNWFCESIANVGNFSAQMPVTISNSTFDCNYYIDKKRLLINSNSGYVQFNNCTIRYYDGLINNVYVHGGTYNNCYFGGAKLIYK